MGASFPEAKVELGRQCDRHTHSFLRVCKAPLPPHQPRGAPGFRWLYRRGPTRSHPEHGSQALQSRWYCTLCVWESRSLPEFFPKTPRRSPEPRGVAFCAAIMTTNVSRGARGEKKSARRNRFSKDRLRALRVLGALRVKRL